MIQVTVAVKYNRGNTGFLCFLGDSFTYLGSHLFFWERLPWPLDEAAARVLPVRSSTNCTYICLLLLNTVIRGRSAVPETLPRMRVLILSLLSIFVVMIIPV